jgi:hypothetical protein
MKRLIERLSIRAWILSYELEERRENSTRARCHLRSAGLSVCLAALQAVTASTASNAQSGGHIE